MKLRDYQRRGVDSPIKYWQEGKGNHPIIVGGTGSGKSVIQAFFVKEAIEKYPKTRILCVTHVQELIEQNHDTFKTIWPQAPSGVFSSGLNRKDDEQVLFAGIQSIHKKAFDFDPFDLMIIDEAHLLPKKDGGMYRTFIKNLMINNPRLKVVGLTASPFRLDGGSLIDGEGALFDGISCHITIKELLEGRWLTPLTTKDTKLHINTTELKTANGDFTVSSQEIAFKKDNLTDKILDEVLERAKDRKCWMIFCSSVSHCEEVAEKLNKLGIKTKAVHGGLTKAERKLAISELKSGDLHCLVSVNILTTGVDIAQVDLIVFLRSTKSASLYLQICGRGMRLFLGKLDCLVLDYGENILIHGAVDEIVERQLAMGGKKKGKKGQAVMKRCPKCDVMVYASVIQCPECNAYFPINTLPKLQQEASRLAILSSEREAKKEWLDVQRVLYRKHVKRSNGFTSMKVTYCTGNMQEFSEYICLDYEGGARTKAHYWWHERYSGRVLRPSVSDALEIIMSEGISEPSRIQVITGGKYDEITGFNWISKPV